MIYTLGALPYKYFNNKIHKKQCYGFIGEINIISDFNIKINIRLIFNHTKYCNESFVKAFHMINQFLRAQKIKIL